ncbi:MAG: diacylglycerol kinase family lipid kinase [Candidatus Promineifilaceae bacterium]
MSIKVIVNPYANRWQAQKDAAQVEVALRSAKLSYDLVMTSAPGDATALAETAVYDGYGAVIAAGGDGTISEVVNGLIAASGSAPTIPFGIIPIGSANDFVRIVHIPLDIIGAVQVIARGHTRQVDAGRVNDHYFINNSAAAMEPMISLEQISITNVDGELRYLLALVKGLFKMKAWQMSVVWDEGSYSGPTYLLSVCNTSRTGGFEMAPGAVIDDGLFDLVLAVKAPMWRVLWFLFKMLRGGKHIHDSAVTFVRTRNVQVISEPGTPLHADGEIIARAATAVTFEILPGKVTLFVPPVPTATGK